MSLTVPTAGSIAGASATVRVATPDTGDVIGAFGAKMADLARGWKADALQIQNTRAQLNITRDLGQARLEVEQLGDPAAIGPAWDAKVAEIQGRYLTDDLDPELSASLQLSLQEMKDRHGFALGEKVINLTKSQQEAGWIEARNDITTQAVTADPETFGALLEVGEAAIDARAQRGLIDPATAAAEKLALREEVYLGRANAAIEADPQGFLTAADAGDFDGLGGQALASRRIIAEREIARRETEGQRAAELATKTRQDTIGKRLSEMTRITAQGFNSADEQWAADPEVQAHPDFAQYAAARALRDEMPGIRQMTEAELNAAIAVEEARPKTFEYQTERVKVLRGWRDQIAADYNTAAVETSIKAGLPVPALPTFDPADPQPFAEGLTARLSFDASVRKEGRTKGQAVFTADDRKALEPILDPKADTGPKIALAEAIVAGSGRDAARITGLLGADPVFARAVKTVSTTGDRGLAAELLRGQQKIELKTAVVPSQPDQQQVFDNVTGGLFANDPRMAEEIMTAARALYADGATGADPSTAPTPGEAFIDDSKAVDLYARAVQRVIGATPDASGNLTIGGLQEFNGGMVALPPGVPLDRLEAAWDDLNKKVRGELRSAEYPGMWNNAGAFANDQHLSAFKAASIYGGVPDLGSRPSDLLADLTLQRIGETDVYQLTYQSNGRTYTVPQKDDPNGTAYQFRLPDLLREAAR